MKKSLFLVVLSFILFLSACSEPGEDEEFSDAIGVAELWPGPLPEGAIVPSFGGWTVEEIEALSSKQITWGPGRQVDERNRPLAGIALQELYARYQAYFLLSEEKEICLTFDEGYENGYTSEILDTLKKTGVPAVFFITLDYAEREPELVRRMIEEGHQVGNHSTHHPNITRLSVEEVVTEVAELHTYMEEHFGYTMTLFRAPEGAISEQSMAIIQSLGYKNVLWSFAYQDYDVSNQPGEATALKRLCGALHPGAIYLLHAVSRTNAEVLEEFINVAGEAGYRFVGM